MNQKKSQRDKEIIIKFSLDSSSKEAATKLESKTFIESVRKDSNTIFNSSTKKG